MIPVCQTGGRLLAITGLKVSPGIPACNCPAIVLILRLKMLLKKIIIGETSDLPGVVSSALDSAGFPYAVSKTPVLDSLGTLALSDWNLHPVIKYTEHQASQNRRPFLHINIDGMPIYEIPSQINRFIEFHKTQYLHVIAVASEESTTFGERVGTIIDNVILMGWVKAGNGKIEGSGTVDDLVAEVLAELSLREKSEIANLGEDALRLLQLHVDRLVARRAADVDRAAGRREVMRQVWLRLRETHRLRVVE